jgi:hypothetical protein
VTRAPWDGGPLRVTAHLQGQIVLPSGSIALDGLLAWAVACRDGLPPPTVQIAQHGALPAIEIPVAREPGGRFHLASFARASFDAHEPRYTNRRFPATEALHLSAIRTVKINAGAEKSYRLPYTASHVAGDRLDWWCVGKRDQIAALLALVHHVGKKRSVGYGRVARWEVEPCREWEGFPVVRDGAPLRPLPLDWPGLVDPAPGYACLTYPYWERAREEACAVPA